MRIGAPLKKAHYTVENHRDVSARGFNPLPLVGSSPIMTGVSLASSQHGELAVSPKPHSYEGNDAESGLKMLNGQLAVPMSTTGARLPWRVPNYSAQFFCIPCRG